MMSGPRELGFEEKRHAVHIKLTGLLWESLQNAQQSKQKVTMSIGKDNVIQVGETLFPFYANPVTLQDVVRVPSGQEEPCSEVAQVFQRIHVQRQVDEAERQRVRLRGLEAENQRKGRVAQVLSKAPVQAAGGRRVINKTVVRSSTPPVQRPEMSRPGQTVRRATPPPRGSTPPASLQPASAPATAVNVKAKASAVPSRLGTQKANMSPSPGPISAPRLAVLAAQTHCSLRKVLVACIGNDRPKKPKLDQMLQDVAQQVSSFKSGKDDVSRILKDIADFKAPGVYILRDYIKLKELEPMQKALLGEAAKEKADVPAKQPPRSAKAEEKASRERSLSPSPRPRSTSPVPQGKRRHEGDQSERPAAKKSRPNAKSQSIATPTVEKGKSEIQAQADSMTDRKSTQEALKPEKGEKEKKKKRKKQKTESKTPLEDGEGQPPAKRAKSQAEPAKHNAAGKEATSDAPTMTEANASAMTNIDASSLGIEDCSWFEEFARPPDLVSRTIGDKHAFDEMYDKHEKDHAVYMRLGSSISKFKRKYQALQSASQAGGGQEQVHATLYYERHMPALRRMSTAFKCLHAELGVMENSLTAYCEAQGLPSPRSSK